MRHIIWDWNGTLLDDFPLVLDAVDHTVRIRGGQPVTADDYRQHYRRPVRLFYEVLTGQAITEAAWQDIDADFHHFYNDRALEPSLFPEARRLLSDNIAAGRSQSLLSMYYDCHLRSVVDHHAIVDSFNLIQGLQGAPGSAKAEHLETHLRTLAELGTRREQTVMIGDTPDDAAAAQAHGIPVILFDGGSHNYDILQAVGVPVATTLNEAMAIALDQ